MAIALLPQAAAAWQKPVDRDMERAYEFIASLPKDALVAAHPDLADDVPLRTRHSVLASTEESIAFMQGYYRRLVPRIEASLRAAYATSWDELETALEPYDVDVVLTAPIVWNKDGLLRPIRQARAAATRARQTQRLRFAGAATGADSVQKWRCLCRARTPRSSERKLAFGLGGRVSCGNSDQEN